MTQEVMSLKRNVVHDHNHGKYVATSEFNSLAAKVFNTR